MGHKPFNGIPNAKPTQGYPSIVAFCKAHGLSIHTVKDRLKRGEFGAHLRRPPENRGKEILWGGKTFRQWHKIVGGYITLNAVKSFYYQRPKDESPEDCLTRFKRHHNL